MGVVIVSYNGSGTFQINTTGQPVVTGTVISSTAFNALTADLATGLSTAITKDGQTATTARIPFAAGISSTLVTDSSSVSTGSIITAGGVGIAKALYVGTTSNLAGAATLGSTLTYGGVTLTNAVTGTNKMVLDTSPTLVTPALGTPASGVLTNCTGVQYTGFKNRIINGAMVIDQRNAGASVTPANGAYTLDRYAYSASQASKFTVQQNAASVTPPSGFSNYLGATVASAVTIGAGDFFAISQSIEGFNFSDMAWGTASAATVTLSFWVRSSLTGTFGGALRNSAGNRSYPFTYTISSANTWEQKSVTIAGDISGTWIGATNGIGVTILFGLGVGSTYSGTASAWAGANYLSATGATSVVGTNTATFYITGVQLEKGSTATSFDYRPYGIELALCQRYYEKSYSMASIAGASTNTGKGSFNVGAAANTFWRWTQNYCVSKRADSTFTIYSTTGASGNVRLNNASDLAVSTEDAGENATAIFVSRNASLGDFFWWQWTASAEL